MARDTVVREKDDRCPISTKTPYRLNNTSHAYEKKPPDIIQPTKLGERLVQQKTGEGYHRLAQCTTAVNRLS